MNLKLMLGEIIIAYCLIKQWQFTLDSKPLQFYLLKITSSSYTSIKRLKTITINNILQFTINEKNTNQTISLKVFRNGPNIEPV